MAAWGESIACESVDLIYLDPPFNSNSSYSVLFKAPWRASEIPVYVRAWNAERAPHLDNLITVIEGHDRLVSVCAELV